MAVSRDNSFVGADGYGFVDVPTDGISHKNATTTTVTGGGVDYDFSSTALTLTNLVVTGTYTGPGGGGSGGTVTSVGLSLPSIFTVAGTPVTTTGTLTGTLAGHTANFVFAGPASGAAAAPTFRALVAADIPTIPSTKVSGLAASTTTDTTNASNIASGTVAGARVGVFGPSGTNHSTGGVPDPGVTAGTIRYLREDATWGMPAGGSGTVTSVGLIDGSTAPIYGSGGTVTTSGNLSLNMLNQGGNKVFAAPANGATSQPSFRALVAADIPTLPYSTGTVTSVAAAPDAGGILSWAGSPITSSGTLTPVFASQSGGLGTVFAAPTSGPGAPVFRALVNGDFQALSLAGDVSSSGLTTAVTKVGGATAANVATAASLATTSAAANRVVATPNGATGEEGRYDDDRRDQAVSLATRYSGVNAESQKDRL